MLGSVLQDFYNSCERVFKRISSEINGAHYQGEAWHKELLYRIIEPTLTVDEKALLEGLKADDGVGRDCRV